MTLLYKNGFFSPSIYFLFLKIFPQGFAKDEISFYKNVIFSNVFLGFRSLIDGADLLGT